MAVTYKVVDNPSSPSTSVPSEQMLNAQGQAGWALNNFQTDPQRERTRFVFTQSGGTPTYKVVDQPWSPSDPTIPETMLNTQGTAGWSLLAVYPDSHRERTRWIFGQGIGTGGGGGTGISDAPVDGNQYARFNATWAVVNDTTKVLKAGDTMTGPLTVAGNITSSFAATPTQGAFAFGNSGSKYLQYDGSLYRFVGGPLVVQDATVSSSPTTGALTVVGGVGIGKALYAGDSTATALVVNGKERQPSTTLTDAYALFRSSNGGYPNFSFGGMVNSPFDAWVQIHNGAATPLALSLNPVGGGVKLGDASASYNTAVFSTAASTSPTTGALTVGGGLGVAGDVYAGGGLQAYNVNINPSSGDSLLKFFRAGALQSFIQDNGSTINVSSNNAGTAGMYITHGASAWTALSDARLPWKKNARPLNALDRLECVQLYENEVDGRLELFGKAQELFQSFPHIVTKGDDHPDDIQKAWGVAYDRLGLVALQAVKELLAELQQLKARIEDLEASGVKTPS